MKFSLVVAGSDVDRAIAAIGVAESLGCARVWLTGNDARKVFEAANTRLALVLAVDPGEDSQLPAGSGLEVAVTGKAGWADSLGALVKERSIPFWVFATDVGTVAAAARAGVGAAFEPLENPDDASEWTSEYEAELGADSARALMGTVNAACAVFVDLPGKIDDAVGLIERYREAEVDEVILRGDHADDAELVRSLIAEFDDPEVREAAEAKATRIAPVTEALQRRPAARESKPATQRKQSGFARWVTRQQEGAVRRMSDGQLDALVGSRVGVRGLFMAMAKRYRPEKSAGFNGAIEFTLHTSRGPAIWTIDCDEHGASARRGGDEDAKLHVEAKIADFLRVGTGEISAPSAVLSGQLNVRGDFALALRMGDMFGGPSIV